MHEFAFSVESVAELRDEIQPLLAEHWELVSQRYSRSTLSPDVNLYQALEDACALRLFTVRSSGDLVGYASVFVITHPHRIDELTATVDAIYLRSAYRGLGAAERFLRYIEDALRVAEVRTLGVSVQDEVTARWFSMAGIFRMSGWWESRRNNNGGISEP